MSERSVLPPPGESFERVAQRSRILGQLGRRLGGATTLKRVAETVVEAAGELLGWDACAVNLYSPESDSTTCILAIDVIEGQRTDVTSANQEAAPSAKLRQIIADGAQLILRDECPKLAPDVTPFGDTHRPSASLMFVPIRCGKRVTGVLTIQSYSVRAYTDEDLGTLQALADHCGANLGRIQAETMLARTEDLYRRAIGGVGAVPYIYDYRSRAYLFIGDGIEQLIGYSPDEVNGELWSTIIKDLVMTGEAAGLDRQEAARRVLAGELRHWSCDMRVMTRGGKVRWISDASVQNLDDAGRPIGSLGILEDITERKQSELSALALSRLAQGLLAASTVESVARLLAKVADELFGWDACAFHLHNREKDEITPVLLMDTVNGRRIEMAPPGPEHPPTAVARRVMEKGAELSLREEAPVGTDPGTIIAGHRTRPSPSIMRAPVRLSTNRFTGIVSFHSYSVHAYGPRDLTALQTLADCCGVGLERVVAEAESERMFIKIKGKPANG